MLCLQSSKYITRHLVLTYAKQLFTSALMHRVECLHLTETLSSADIRQVETNSLHCDLLRSPQTRPPWATIAVRYVARILAIHINIGPVYVPLGISYHQHSISLIELSHHTARLHLVPWCSLAKLLMHY